MIKRLLLAAAFVSACRKWRFAAREHAARFDAKLSPEQKILQALNRLTFGARPGDIEEVRRLGVEKWIELQLHPERIAENPALEARLKPLDTIRMETGRNLQQVLPAVSAGLCPAGSFERTAARRAVPQGLQRHGGGTARGHHGARSREAHEGARRRSSQRRGGPAGPSEGTGRRTPEAAGRAADGNAAHAAAAQRIAGSAAGPGSAARNAGAARRPVRLPGCRQAPEDRRSFCRRTRLPASPNCAAWARCRVRRSRW